jgi:hypothetical protein
MRVCVYEDVCRCVYVRVHERVHVHVHIDCIHIYIYMYIFVYISLFSRTDLFVGVRTVLLRSLASTSAPLTLPAGILDGNL